jgi:hypothetical protein
VVRFHARRGPVFTSAIIRPDPDRGFSPIRGLIPAGMEQKFPNRIILFGSDSWNLNIWNSLGIPLDLKHHARFHAAKSRLRLLDSIVLFLPLEGGTS